MPAQPAHECLGDEVDDLGATKVRYLRAVDHAIRDGVVTADEQQRIALERAALKAQFRIVRHRVVRLASGNRLLRMLANTGEITPKVDRLYRELHADHARIIEFPGRDDDGPDDSGAALRAA